MPVSAELWIDGSAVTTTPCRIDVDSGVHSFELRAEKFETWKQIYPALAPVSKQL